MAGVSDHSDVYGARLGRREKFFFVALGCGVLLGIPVMMSLTFALAFRTPGPLAIGLPFVAAFVVIVLFRTTGYRFRAPLLEVTRPAGVRRFRLDVSIPAVPLASLPQGSTAGIVHSSGFLGTSGSFWNRGTGKFYVYVTDGTRVVGLTCADGRRLFISPLETGRFLSAFSEAASTDAAG